VAGTSIEKHGSGADDGHGGHGGPGGHGEVEVARHGDIVSYNPDAPSEEWGWHGHFSDFAPRGRFALLGLGIVALLLMTIGNTGHVEDFYLVGIAVVMAAWMFRTYRARKRERRLRP
jgi:hypothetical protein